MAVPSKHILRQTSVIASMGKVALSAALQGRKKSAPRPVATPGPLIERTVAPLPRDLIRDYVRAVGGDPANYKKEVPAHLFPQWGFPLATETLLGVNYPLAKVVNAGCRIESHAPIPVGEPLQVTAQLVDIDDDGYRAIMHQKVTTGTKSAPGALEAHLYALVPLKRREGPRKDKARVPLDVSELLYAKVRADAGLDFAKLTGDFNPIHWVPAYAKAAGFKNTILHGFATLARAYEGLRQNALGRSRISTIDVKFTRPLVLPARVGLYQTADRKIYVGDAPGGPAYLTGSYTAKDAS